MRTTPLRVVHAVRSDSFAGVERYVCDVAGELTAHGVQVTVVGGDPVLVRTNLPEGVRSVPAASTSAVALALVRLGRQDVVHVHMTAAEAAGVVTRPVHRGRVIATRHFARTRGASAPAAALATALARGISAEISISDFVAASTGPGSVVLHNGVPSRPLAAADRRRTVLVMQRLEAEKQTDLAVRAFARSGLAAAGWRLQIAGRGQERDGVVRVAADERVAVEMLGFVEAPEQVLSSAGVLLAPAPAEPFGLTVVEAMASGTAVLASDGGAHPETLGPDGRLFRSGDVEDCADQLQKLAADEEGRAAYGARLHQRQRELFDLTRHVVALLAHYRAVARPEDAA